MKVEYSTESGHAALIINNVEVDDEAIYKCEITYIQVKETCHDVVQIVNFTTLGKFWSKRNSVNLIGTSTHIIT